MQLLKLAIRPLKIRKMLFLTQLLIIAFLLAGIFLNSLLNSKLNIIKIELQKSENTLAYLNESLSIHEVNTARNQIQEIVNKEYGENVSVNYISAAEFKNQVKKKFPELDDTLSSLVQSDIQVIPNILTWNKPSGEVLKSKIRSLSVVDGIDSNASDIKDYLFALNAIEIFVTGIFTISTFALMGLLLFQYVTIFQIQKPITKLLYQQGVAWFPRVSVYFIVPVSVFSLALLTAMGLTIFAVNPIFRRLGYIAPILADFKKTINSNELIFQLAIPFFTCVIVFMVFNALVVLLKSVQKMEENI